MRPWHSCIEEESSKNHIENAVITALYEMTSSLKGGTRDCLLLIVTFIKNMERKKIICRPQRDLGTLSL